MSFDRSFERFDLHTRCVFISNLTEFKIYAIYCYGVRKMFFFLLMPAASLACRYDFIRTYNKFSDINILRVFACICDSDPQRLHRPTLTIDNMTPMTPTPPTVPLMRVIRRLCWFYPLAHATREHGVKVRRTQRRRASASATRVKFLGESFLWCLNARMRVSCAPAQSLTHALRVCIMVARIGGIRLNHRWAELRSIASTRTHASNQPNRRSQHELKSGAPRACALVIAYAWHARAREAGIPHTHTHPWSPRTAPCPIPVLGTVRWALIGNVRKGWIVLPTCTQIGIICAYKCHIEISTSRELNRIGHYGKFKLAIFSKFVTQNIKL